MCNHISCKNTITIKIFLCAALPPTLSSSSSWRMEECSLLSLSAPRKRRREEELREILPIPHLQPTVLLLPVFLNLLQQSRTAACIHHRVQGINLDSICASTRTSQTQWEGHGRRKSHTSHCHFCSRARIRISGQRP